VKLREWEIWHSYSTYLNEQKINLEHAAKELVDSGLALCSMHRDGRTYWQSGKGTQSGQTKIILDSKQMNAKIMLKTDSGQDENKGTVLCLTIPHWHYKLSLGELICREQLE